MESNTTPPLKSLQEKVDPVWEILIKHLDTLPRERYPVFSVRKRAVEAMIEYASQFKSEAETLRKEIVEISVWMKREVEFTERQHKEFKGNRDMRARCDSSIRTYAKIQEKAESLISKYDKKN
jgi:hypothetical protein